MMASGVFPHEESVQYLWLWITRFSSYLIGVLLALCISTELVQTEKGVAPLTRSWFFKRQNIMYGFLIPSTLMPSKTCIKCI